MLSPQRLCCQDWILKAKHLCDCNELSIGYVPTVHMQVHACTLHVHVHVGGWCGAFYSVTVLCFGVCVCTCVLLYTIVLHCLEVTIFSLSLSPALSHHDQQWYAVLTGSLTQEQIQKIQQIFLYAEQRKALRGEFSSISIHLS